jgi:hypothetical protein
MNWVKVSNDIIVVCLGSKQYSSSIETLASSGTKSLNSQELK